MLINCCGNDFSAEALEERPVSLHIPRDHAFPWSERLKNPEEIRIVAIGDSGTGSPDQMKVARDMEKFCAEQGCDLGLLLGDNFHPAGVKSVDDPQFFEKFENCMAARGVPFFAILGAHDWGRKGEKYNWKAPIEYTERAETWHMPSEV